MGNRSSTLSLFGGGEHTAASSNKRKREEDDDDDSAELRASKQTLVQQPGIVIVGNNNILPTFSNMPESILLHVFSFILKPKRNMVTDRRSDTLSVQLALEQTCRRFSALLGKDSTMKLLYRGTKKEFQYQVETMREKFFLLRGLEMILRFQKRGDALICGYMGGADGVRTIIDKMLVKMEVPQTIVGSYIAHSRMIGPPFAENGFKLFLRGDSIAYLTEVVEQHMISRLTSAMRAAMFRSNPKESHPYPILCENDIKFIDSIRSFDSGSFNSCTICSTCSGRHGCKRLSFSNLPKVWEWPEDNCLEEDIIGAEQRQRMVRAITSRAGIVKLTGGAFDCIAAEILHAMAIIVVHAFEASKSLWCHNENIGAYFDDHVNGFFYHDIDDNIDEVDDHSNDYEVDFSNQPPPPVHFDEEGKQLCVIIPRQIKDAAVRIGMKPLLDDHGWEAGEGRSRDEEEEEARLMYHESSSEDDSSDEESDDDAQDEDADSNGGSGEHVHKAGEGEVNMSAGEVVEADFMENLSGAIEATNDENDSSSCSSLSFKYYF